ncbi:GGDEF domain-containing protein [Billgrantia pellis]|uniref:diguanylate cyclase n=1 Tax=Billgrantia pellis TaxID=2606936 RepID=A0A7V7G1K5_9GAMM|nr:GGDEF domain-containing protein [Halomonas pellis]KAA0013615.1 GGDEF domain-containing protein [Halomonas pellis]
MLPDSLSHSLEGCTQLPSLPQVLLNVIELARDPNVNMRDMVAAIGNDPALSVQLLSLANTVFYANQRPVEDLQQAVSRLGIERTLSLALSCSLVATTDTRKAANLNLERYWQRSLVSAMSARLLANNIGLSADSSALFTAALLQDVGMLGLHAVDTQRYLTLLAQASKHRSLVALEQDTYGTDHAEVGAWLARKWKLSERTAEWIRDSHQTMIIAETPEQRAKNCIVASGLIADAWLQGEAATSRHATQLAGFFGLESSEMIAHLISLQEQLPSVAMLYNVSPPERLDPNQIMHEAKMLLLERTARLQQDLQQKQQELELLRLEQEELALRARLDSLTELYNREHLEKTLRQQFDETRRTGDPLSIVFVDLDHFKEVNDRFGHDVGDEVLIKLSSLMRQAINDQEIHAGRYGGDEFILILPGYDMEQARTFAEVLRAKIGTLPWVTSASDRLQITASFGLATIERSTPYQNVESLIRAADRCMYRSKHDGRDRISAV